MPPNQPPFTLSEMPATKEDEELPEKKNKETEGNGHRSQLLFTVDECPPWYTCIILGLQHFLMMVESTVSIPYLLTPLMCMAQSDPARGDIASTIVFVSGLVTLLQTSLGVRLPIIQGGTHGFLGPILAILTLLPCPSDEVLSAMTPEERESVWHLRMNNVQGAICVAAIFQVVVGFTGAVGILLRWISPLVITPTISLIGLSLFKVAAEKGASHWGITALTVFLLILFSQYLSNVAVPFVRFSERKFKRTQLYIFKLFPVLLALILAWVVCFILTATDQLEKTNHARTDLRLNMITEAPWFRLPYPGQWGVPVVTLAGVVGMLAGVLASIVESIGDYYACARLSGAVAPPTHAINRGIGIEGIGTMLAGLFGTGTGTTSYSQNVGAIAVTGVGSRRVIQYAAGIMLLCGIVGKIGALFINIPEPIIGGIFFVVFAMITAVGLSSLQFVDLNSSRNLFVLGFSLFVGMALPNWMQNEANKNVIQTTIPMLDQVIEVLLKTPMFVGGFLGFILDNTIPGTREERGLVAWEQELQGSSVESTEESKTYSDSKPHQFSTYDLPLGMTLLRKYRCSRYIPVSPTFSGWSNLRKRRVFPVNSEASA